MVKIKRACWNCKSRITCEVLGKSKKGNYHCKEHKFMYHIKLNNQ